MHAADQDVIDSARREQVPDLDTRVANRVTFLDRDPRMLVFPRPLGIAADALEQFMPLGEFDGVVIFAAIGLIDGIDLGVFAFDRFAHCPMSAGRSAAWGAFLAVCRAG